MDQENKSLFQRIRNAKQSLENAEKSFKDDKGIRGELDLMLAEAELKNLRNKKGIALSWNRQILAFSMAMLLAIAGISGWFFAKEDMQNTGIVPVVSNPQKTDKVVKESPNENNFVKNEKNIQPENNNGANKAPGIQLSNQDMRRLVRSAKSELSSGKQIQEGIS